MKKTPVVLGLLLLVCCVLSFFVFQEEPPIVEAPPVETPTTEPPAQSLPPSVVISDINPQDWYAPYVQYVVDYDIMPCHTENAFLPDLIGDRGTVANGLTGLYYHQNPTAKDHMIGNIIESNHYPDAVGTEYLRGTELMKSLEVMTGYPDGTFGVYEAIKREEFAVTMAVYAQRVGGDYLPPTEDHLSSFQDYEDISFWAVESLNWCVSKGLMGGYEGMISPGGYISRGEIATAFFMYNHLSANF